MVAKNGRDSSEDVDDFLHPSVNKHAVLYFCKSRFTLSYARTGPSTGLPDYPRTFPGAHIVTSFSADGLRHAGG